MADELTPEQSADNEVLIDARLSALLADPAVWAEPDQNAEASIVAAIAAAQQHGDPAREPDGAIAETSDNVVAISAARRWMAPFLAGAAAALLVVAGVVIVPQGDGNDSDEVAIAMEGTPLAPAASATADVSATPLGTRIDLAVAGLSPAPEGSYYEAWLRQSVEVGVSAGTFHLRGGDGAIELWAGVDLEEYPLITVTLQREGAGAASSRVVVLRSTAG